MNERLIQNGIDYQAVNAHAWFPADRRDLGLNVLRRNSSCAAAMLALLACTRLGWWTRATSMETADAQKRSECPRATPVLQR
ncbi:hypothetical protein GGD55_000630 [Rhizobium giardinii]|jgi:hypothetical protein|uniref:Uncharacterized protein n=1 Tax=Rhizobium giardinii TaxID=56731 RepID=A0A7W8U6Y9_9HYPH|nr:hypothetical protein [Rhizobium giardinii]